MSLLSRFQHIDRRQKIRYGVMVLGILALAPPVGFLAQAAGSSTICGNLCPRMAIGPNFVREVFIRTWGVVLLLTWLGITLFAGRWVCSHFCPVGGLTEFGSKLVPKRFRVDYTRKVDAPLFRYGFLAAYLALPMAGMASICCSYCTFSTIPEFFGALFNPRQWSMALTGSRMLTFILFGIVLGAFARDGRGHCHLACPVGAVDSIINVIGAKLPFALRTRIDLSNCKACGICAEDCPAAAIRVDRSVEVYAKIDHRRCYNCRTCEASCPRGAIAIGRPHKVKGEGYGKENELVVASKQA